MQNSTVLCNIINLARPVITFFLHHRFVPCGHTVCATCIEKLQSMASNSVVCGCPICRKPFNPKIKLQKNYTLIEVLETSTIPEDGLQNTEKEDKKEKIRKMLLEGIIFLETSSTSVISPCPKHPTKKVKFFCLTCDMPICSKCFATDHVRHLLEKPLQSRNADTILPTMHNNSFNIIIPK